MAVVALMLLGAMPTAVCAYPCEGFTFAVASIRALAFFLLARKPTLATRRRVCLIRSRCFLVVRPAADEVSVPDVNTNSLDLHRNADGGHLPREGLSVSIVRYYHTFIRDGELEC